MDLSTSVIVALAALVLYGLKTLLFAGRKQLPLPPGPKPKPIIGNMLDMPKPGQREWPHWIKHRALYGPVSSVSALGMTFIICNEPHVAHDLLEKRSAVNSSRPHLVFGGELAGWQDLLASMVYGETFRSYRRNFHNLLGTKKSAARFHPVLEVEAHRFLLRVLDKPESLLQHIRTEAGAMILKIVYGYTIEPYGNDPLVDLADEALTQFSQAYGAGMWLVDLMPFLRYLPEWFPGASFQTKGRLWKQTLHTLVESPYNWVKTQMKKGTNKPSFVSSLLENAPPSLQMSPEDEFIARWSAASIYTGGADTTVSSVASFYLAISFRPEVQQRAQEEIDRVVGTDRLPTWTDREHLPYVEAVFKEALRWHPVIPGVAHASTEEHEYMGYRIPKGAAIYPNIWAYTHDPDTYSDPMLFKPERFLGEKPDLDPTAYIWGFGRRVCPGRVIADYSIWLNLVSSLACFDVRRVPGPGADSEKASPTGLDASECRPELFVAGTISHPAPFDVSVKPRSEKHRELIRRVEVEHPWGENDAKDLREVIIERRRGAASEKHAKY
ncbi:cytochrome P450 [Biscogniauxia marginata]|nr:cytochrome P450 [Biscogniauxia marginata]